MILKGLAVGQIAANCYIAGSEVTKEGIVVDPGGDAERIIELIKSLELDIKYIILTHSHWDHIGALKEIKEATGAEIAMHTDEVKSLPGRSLSSILGVSDPASDKLLSGGDSLEVGDLHFLILHTPGHSPGGISILGSEVVFTGDTLFNQGVGRSDFPGCSHSQLMNSIFTKLMVLPDETIVCPGHGPTTTIGSERKNNPFIRAS